MAIVFDVLEEERQRLQSLKQLYEKQIAELPRGSLSRKKRWNKEYVYRAFRESGRVKFEYVGPVGSEAAEEIGAQIKRRRGLEDKLKKVRENLKDVERGLRARR